MARCRLLPSPSWTLQLEAWARPMVAPVVASTKHALHWASAHTGLPVVVIAALALVVTWRVARRSWHVGLELALALAVLVVATHLGWIRW